MFKSTFSKGADVTMSGGGFKATPLSHATYLVSEL